MRPVIASILCAVILASFPAVQGSFAATVGQETSGEVYIVQTGDTLSGIARDQLGDVNAWQQILDATNAKAAEDAQFTAITDETVIEVGQRLWIPIPAPVEPAPPSDESSDEPSGGSAVIPDPEATEDASTELGEEPADTPPIAESTAITESAALTATGLITTAQLFIPYSEDGRLYGYADESGEVQIEPAYVIARRFSEGLAVVSQDGLRFGYIDTTGALVIPADFSDAGPFSDGLAAVRAGDSIPKLLFYDYELDEDIEISPSGYINQDGDFEIAPAYAYAEPFHDGVAIVWDEFSDRSFLNRAGEIVQQKGGAAPTTEGILSRSDLASAIASIPARDGLCENESSFGQDSHVWSCRVDEELFDPCFVQEPSETVFGCELNDEGLFVCGQQPAPPALVCGYPLNPFTVSDFDISADAAVLTGSTINIERYRLWLDVEDGTSCMLMAQDSLPDVVPTQLYVCSDGTFIVDDLWEVGNSGVWIARTVQLSGTAPDYEFVESAVAIVDRISDFSTSLDAEQPAGDIIPPPLPGVYWHH